jgi:hypothetical protein
MTASPWKLDEHQARLQLGCLTARVQVAWPSDGLVDLAIAGLHLSRLRLLGVAIPFFVPGDTASIIEQHVRGSDLVLSYRDSESCPVRVDVVWRGQTPDPDDPSLAAVELLVSVRTYLLQAGPQLSIRSTLPAVEALRLRDPDRAEFRQAVAPDQSWVPFVKPSPGCTLVRLADHPCSYVEMVHPSDFICDELMGGTDPDVALHLRHRLFPPVLEKGVLLRARLLGAVVDRRGDQQRAAHLYRRFCASEPCLSV